VNRDLIRYLILGISLVGLVAVFLFQEIDLARQLGMSGRSVDRFIVNRTFRFLLNDLFAIGVIYGLFHEKKYVLFSVWVQVVGTIVFLIPYFIVKLNYPSYNGPLINYLHRLILNPTLLLLLIPAFYFQKNSQSFGNR
jgi:exosortase F-associated protein